MGGGSAGFKACWPSVADLHGTLAVLGTSSILGTSWGTHLMGEMAWGGAGLGHPAPRDHRRPLGGDDPPAGAGQAGIHVTAD